MIYFSVSGHAHLYWKVGMKKKTERIIYFNKIFIWYNYELINMYIRSEYSVISISIRQSWLRDHPCSGIRYGQRSDKYCEKIGRWSNVLGKTWLWKIKIKNSSQEKGVARNFGHFLYRLDIWQHLLEPWYFLGPKFLKFIFRIHFSIQLLNELHICYWKALIVPSQYSVNDVECCFLFVVETNGQFRHKHIIGQLPTNGVDPCSGECWRPALRGTAPHAGSVTTEAAAVRPGHFLPAQSVRYSTVISSNQICYGNRHCWQYC